jgi:hypothetical protein
VRNLLLFLIFSEAMKAFISASDVLASEGQFMTATKYLTRLAEMYEKAEEWTKAQDAWERASSYSESDHAPRFIFCRILVTFSRAQCDCLVRAVSCLLNHSTRPDYPKALELLELIGDLQNQNELTKYGAKQYWFDALFCIIASGVLACLSDY